MAAVLKREGFLVGRARVQTALREMGIEGIHPGPTNLSKQALEHKIYQMGPQCAPAVGGFPWTVVDEGKQASA